ncbi:DUF2785 domain-containing protein [Leuconostocaceae bacterium ESL0958]|nr:DUF2785 domain-containing protein [Leuconostocaceae bacterium ESL0958]
MTAIENSREQVALLLAKTQAGHVFESLPGLLHTLRENQEVTPLDEDQFDWQRYPAHGDERRIPSVQERADFEQSLTDRELRQCLDYLGYPSWTVRESGPFVILASAIQNGRLNADQMAFTTASVIGDQQLLRQLQEEENDGAYRRSDSLALLAFLLQADQSATDPFISPDLLAAIVVRVATLALFERDSRGFVPGRGWIHLYAHLATVLEALFERTDLTRADKIFLMGTTLANLRSLNQPLTMGEMPRLVRVLLRLTQRHPLYRDYFLLSLKLWRQDLVQEPFAQTRSAWQKIYNRVDFFQQILAAGSEEVPEEIWHYVQNTKNYLS